ncbi:MAG: helix-turn-helix transcriptional regulator [Treponema sp.]|nr:helix-turn-helix transcriptional regulator [Treponema sp.]
METFKKNLRFLSLARLFSFLGLLFLSVKTFLVVALCDFISNGNMVILRLALFMCIGIFLGMLLCPLFIPSPGQKKPLFAGIGFILFFVVPNIALRSLGLQRWLGSEVISAVITTLTNILYPLCCGLFFLTHTMNYTHAKTQRRQDAKINRNIVKSENRTGRYCVFLFALVLAAGMAGRYGLLPALSLFGISPDPSGSMVLLHTINMWLVAGTGLSAIICITLLNMQAPSELATVEPRPGPAAGTSGTRMRPNGRCRILPFVHGPKGRTNWRMIFSLISIAAVSKLLNSMMGIRFLPIINYSIWTEKHLLLLMIGGLIILGFLAGRSILIFLRWYLPCSVALFILLPCIVLFDNSSRFVLLIDTILAVYTNTTWAVFTVALIELFLPAKQVWHNSFCFYILAGIIHFTNIIISLSPIISRHIPPGTGYSVWIIGIAAMALILLSVIALIPNQITKNKEQKTEGETAQRSIPDISSFEDIFNKYGLSKREIEVAGLILTEGLGTREIGKRLFITTDTVNSHIKKIFQKFDVNSRTEFMSRFVSVSAKND